MRIAHVVSSILVVLAVSCGGEPPAVEVADPGAEVAADLNAGKECFFSVLEVNTGALAELKAALGPAFLKSFGGNYYPHLQVPGVLDAALGPADSATEWFYALPGWDLRISERAGDRTMVATIAGDPRTESALVTARRHYEAAKTLFTALSRAKETVENHVVKQPAYDRSWKRTTRTSATGRWTCTATVYPDTQETRPAYECVLTAATASTSQIFNTRDGACPVK